MGQGGVISEEIPFNGSSNISKISYYDGPVNCQTCQFLKKLISSTFSETNARNSFSKFVILKIRVYIDGLEIFQSGLHHVHNWWTE